MSLFASVCSFLSEDGWKFEVIEESRLLRTHISTASGLLTCIAQVWEERGQFAFYTLIPVKCPSARREQAMEFITRSNYGMILGNFEIDLSDGEIRYKTSIDIEDTTITPTHIRHLIYANWTTVDRYLAGLLSVLFSDRNAEDAVNEIEGGGSLIMGPSLEDEN